MFVFRHEVRKQDVGKGTYCLLSARTKVNRQVGLKKELLLLAVVSRDAWTPLS